MGLGRRIHGDVESRLQGPAVFSELGPAVEHGLSYVAGAMLPPSVLLHILVSFGSQASTVLGFRV